jgi:hypothetical protein
LPNESGNTEITARHRRSGRGAKRGEFLTAKPGHPVNGQVHNCLPHEVDFEDAAAIPRARIRRQALGTALGYRQHSLGLPRGEKEFVDQYLQPVAEATIGSFGGA